MNHENIEIFQRLYHLPLFLGMSNDELEHIMTKTKLLFKKEEPENVIAHVGDTCGKLWFLTTGEVSATTYSDDFDYSITEFLHSPLLLQPECAFGVNQRFTHTYKAITTCNLIIIHKEEVMRLADYSLIFRINLMNLVSTALQKSNQKLWRKQPRNLHERVIRFMTDRMIYPAGRKILNIKMERLAKECNDTRINISKVLHDLQNEKLVKLGRQRIEILSAEDLSRKI